MSGHSEEEELNFSELIGNLLTSHDDKNNDDNNNNDDDNNSHKVDDELDHTVSKDHEVDLPDLDDDVGEADFATEVPDFAAVVSNALQDMQSASDEQDNDNTTSSSKDNEDNQTPTNTTKPTEQASQPQAQETDSNGDAINEQQQSEWAQILQHGLYQESTDNINTDHGADMDQSTGNNHSQLNDEGLDQDDENLRRAILETLQGLGGDNNLHDEPVDKNDDLIKPVEIIRKSSKKSSKKKKKEKEKQPATTTTAAKEDKESKKKKQRKEKERQKPAKPKNKNKNQVENDHLIHIDDVIRGIMGHDDLEQNNDANNETKTNVDDNDAETQALVEATLKAFEKELMGSDTITPLPKTVIAKKSHVIPKKPQPKKAAKKPARPIIPTPDFANKDLDYEIPVSTFYPQPKKTTSTTTTTAASKSKKKKKAVRSAATTKKTLAPTVPESSGFEDDDFSKVLAEMVNQVVETSLSEQIDKNEKGLEKKISKKPPVKQVQEPELTEQEGEEESNDNFNWHLHFPENETSEEPQSIHEEDNHEPFDLNQIMKNAMKLAFQTEPEEVTEESIEEKGKTVVEVQTGIQEEHKLLNKNEPSEKSTKLEIPKRPDLIVEFTKDDKMEEKLKKPTKLKKSPKKPLQTKKLDTIKVQRTKKDTVPTKKPTESTKRKKFETIIMDKFQKKLVGNSIDDVAGSIRKLNALTKVKNENKNREIVIRNIEIDRRFADLKTGLTTKSQPPEQALRKKIGTIANAAANEARRRHREKNKILRLKLKEEKERIREAKKAQKEQDQAKLDAEQKELEEIVAKGPPYPADLRVTKKGIPKKPYRRWTPEEMALRAQLHSDSYGEIEDRLKTIKYHKNRSAVMRKSPLFKFVRRNILLNESNLNDIEGVLKKMGLPQDQTDYLLSESGTLGCSLDEIRLELQNKSEEIFDSSAKTVVHREKFMFHPPWKLPEYPPIALPVARRSITKKRLNKYQSIKSEADSAFMNATKKLIPAILNPIINTLKIAAKKRIANGASPEEASRHLLTIINHTRKSIAQVITNVRERQLREPLARVKLENDNTKAVLSALNSGGLNRIPILNITSSNKRTLSNTDIPLWQQSHQDVLKKLPLMPLSKKPKLNLSSKVDFINISDEKANQHQNTNTVQPIVNELMGDASSKKEIIIIDTNAHMKEKDKTKEEKNVQVSTTPLKSVVTDIGTAAALHTASSRSDTPLPIEKSYDNEKSEKPSEVEVAAVYQNAEMQEGHGDKILRIPIFNSTRSNTGTIPDNINISRPPQNLSELAHSSNLQDGHNTEFDKIGNIDKKGEVIEISEPSTSTKEKPSVDAFEVANVSVSKIPITKLRLITSIKESSKTINGSSRSPLDDTVKESSNSIIVETGEEQRSEHPIEDKSRSIDTVSINNQIEQTPIKHENNSELKLIPIERPQVPKQILPIEQPVKVETMVESLVAQQLKGSAEDDDEVLPVGISNIITSTLNDLIPEIEKNFITEGKRQRRSGPNGVLNLDGLVPPSQSKDSEESSGQPSEADQDKPKERKATLQVLYKFEIPDFSNMLGKKNMVQKKLREYLNHEEYDVLRKHISKERKRRWRDANAVQNKINDLRSRLKKRANKTFGVENSKEKLDWLQETFNKKCEEGGFTEFLAQKSNTTDKKDKVSITDNDILNMVAINMNKLDIARKVEASLIEEAREPSEPRQKKRRLDGGMVGSTSVANTLISTE